MCAVEMRTKLLLFSKEVINSVDIRRDTKKFVTIQVK